MGRSDLSAGTLSDSLGDLLNLRTGDEERNVEHVVAEGLITLALKALGLSI